jgi:hypothetical protein
LYNAPFFDANDPEDRNNQQLTGSLSYFLSTKRAGSHDVKGGAERFVSNYKGGNSQTATGYVFYSNYVVDAAGKPLFNADGTLTPRFIPGNSRLYNWLATRGAEINTNTTSLYLQDRWAAGRQLTLDLGMRYERVRSEATGDIVGADTDTIVPRLAATYDVKGNGRWIAQATYGHYAGKYSEAQFAGNSDVANPSLVIYEYTGPAGEGLGFAPGLNPANYTNVLLGSFPTANVFFEDGLSSALNKEFTLSFGGEIGRNGFAKATYVQRKTTNLIDDFIQVSDGTTEVIRNGINFGTYDNILYRNADDSLFREYRAMVFQGRYRASPPPTGPCRSGTTATSKAKRRISQERRRSSGIIPSRSRPSETSPMAALTISSATNCVPGQRTWWMSDASAVSIYRASGAITQASPIACAPPARI